MTTRNEGAGRISRSATQPGNRVGLDGRPDVRRRERNPRGRNSSSDAELYAATRRRRVVRVSGVSSLPKNRTGARESDWVR